jgi:predicted Zn-dependent peptidase
MKFTETVLNNGLRIITVPQKDNPAVTVLVLVATGSKYEKKEINGISHFLEHMCFKGTKNRKTAIEISTELDSVGAVYNAFTGHEFTGYFAKVDKNHFDKALDVVSDIYLNQIFDPKEIDKERGVIIEEINMYEDLPMQRIEEIFTTLLYGDQPAGWDVAGRKEVINKLTRDDFLNYRKNHYVASATTVVIAGSFDERKALGRAKNAFRDISTDKKGEKLGIVEKQEKPEILVKYKESDQSHLLVGVRAYDLFDKRRYALDIIADILGGGMSSRLFEKIRNEMGAAYYVYASSEQFTDHGYLATAAGVDHQKLISVIKAILEEFNKLSQKSVSDKELKKAKDHMIGRLMLGLETSDSLASFYGFQSTLTNEIIGTDELSKRINKVTKEEIRTVAKDIFQNNKLNLSVIGPVKEEKELQSILKIT